jgi:hypothetical protein
MKTNDLTISIWLVYIASLLLYTAMPCRMTSVILIVDTTAFITYNLLVLFSGCLKRRSGIY